MRYDQKLCGMVKNDSVPFMGFLEGDEPPMTACGGNFIGGEISRNKQSRHESELRRLRLRIW